MASTTLVPPRPKTARSSSVFRMSLLAFLGGCLVILAGCGSGPGTREEFVDVLRRDDNFAANEAECIADAVFDEYGEDEDALKKISSAPDYEFLSSEEGVEGFTEFFEQSVNTCTTTGPVPDS